MAAWPYIHSATAAVTPEGGISVAGPEPAAVSTAGFDLAGVADMGSPATLLTCSVAWSFADAFRSEAAASGIRWTTLEVGIDGTIDRNRHGPRFSRFDLTLSLEGIGEREQDIRPAAERALAASLAINSLAAGMHTTLRIHHDGGGASVAAHRRPGTDRADAHG